MVLQVRRRLTVILVGVLLAVLTLTNFVPAAADDDWDFTSGASDTPAVINDAPSITNDVPSVTIELDY